MIKILLKGEVEKLIPFPSEATDIKHEQYIEFKWDSNDISVWLSAQEKAGTLDRNIGTYLSKVATALSNLVGEDINGFYGLPKGDFKNHFKRLTTGISTTYNDADLKDTILGLYERAFFAINNHVTELRKVGEDSEFTHNGINYKFPQMHVDALNGKDINPSFPTGKAIEILERERIMLDQLKRLEETDKGRAELEYNMDITKIAILAEKEGDTFPTSQSEIDRWVNERVSELQDIPMTVGKDLCFFLRLFTRI